MFFAQIIAFILVMVLFEAYQPGTPTISPLDSALGSLAVLIIFWALAGMAVRGLLGRLHGTRGPADPAKAAKRLEFVLNLGALACVAVLIMPLELKAQLVQWPVVRQYQVASGLCAALIYLAALVVVWWSFQPVEVVIFHRAVRRWAYVGSQARFVAPVVFPWFVAAALRDGLALLWPGLDAWLNSDVGDLAFLALFLLIISLLFPPMVRRWWRCSSLEDGPTRRTAQTVLDHLGVRVADIVDWPILEGRVLTAGIVGLVPPLRYLLITKALREALTGEQMAAVVAHEAGHVKYWHIPLYLFFFMGFFFLSYALAEPMHLAWVYLLDWLSGTSWGLSMLGAPADEASTLGLWLSLPMVLFLALYLRFGMGFFMRHFERQADLYSVRVMGDAKPLIQALETISLLSGNVRDVPSWHHFSVAQRVEAMRRAQEEPGYIAAHGAMLRRGLAAYLAVMLLLAGAGMIPDYGSAAMDAQRSMTIRLLEEKAALAPNDATLRMHLGVLRFELGQEEGAYKDLRLAHALVPGDPEIINSLAWLLVTAKDPALRDGPRGLELAQEAVEIKPAPHIWDTLAEAYYVCGDYDKAVAAARAALEAGPTERPGYYQDQLRRFEKAAEGLR